MVQQATRLTRTSVTWALARPHSFANPAAPTTAELNTAANVILLSCALTEDGTSMTLGDSDKDNTITFCSIGNAETLTNFNPTCQWTSLQDANTGGSGTSLDTGSIFNTASALLAFPDVNWWVILRTGKQNSRDSAFAVNDRIKMASFSTDFGVDTFSNGKPVTLVQNFLFSGNTVGSTTLPGGFNWNYKLLT